MRLATRMLDLLTDRNDHIEIGWYQELTGSNQRWLVFSPIVLKRRCHGVLSETLDSVIQINFMILKKERKDRETLKLFSLYNKPHNKYLQQTTMLRSQVLAHRDNLAL